ncbi:MAG TPA: CidA/LrgA family protein [Firmicutes bacterium]|jgi:holin-like protein|nr:CidA/LrgA family protein [Bacillota bacterium]
MKLLRQMGIVLGICLLGGFLQRVLKLPIPGNVLGMLILLGGLCSGLIKLEMIAEVSDFLLDHLAFFFIPAGVGIIACLGLLRGKWLAVLGVCFITTVLIMAVTGHAIQWMQRSRKR